MRKNIKFIAIFIDKLITLSLIGAYFSIPQFASFLLKKLGFAMLISIPFTLLIVYVHYRSEKPKLRDTQKDNE